MKIQLCAIALALIIWAIIFLRVMISEVRNKERQRYYYEEDTRSTDDVVPVKNTFTVIYPVNGKFMIGVVNDGGKDDEERVHIGR